MLEQSHIITLDYGQIHPRFSATKKEAKVITGIEFLNRKKTVTQRATQWIGLYFDKQSQSRIKLLKLCSGTTRSRALD